MPDTPQTPDTAHRGWLRKNRRWFYCAVPFVLVLLIGVGLFSRAPRYRVPELRPEDWTFQTKLLMREVPKIYKAKRGRLRTVTLTPGEVNSLLRFAANGRNLAALFGVGDLSGNSGKYRAFNEYEANYRNGLFHISYALKAAHPLCFGGHIIVQLTGTPQYDGETLPHFVPNRASAGLAPIPAAAVEKMIREQAEKFRQSEEMMLFRTIVKKVAVLPDGSLEIVYSPYELNRYLRSAIGRKN